MDRLNVFTVCKTVELVYEFINTETLLITLDRDEAMSYAQKLIHSLEEPVFADYTYVDVYGSVLGVVSEPIKILAHRTSWFESDVHASSDSADDKLNESDFELFEIERKLTKIRKIKTGLKSLHHPHIIG